MPDYSSTNKIFQVLFLLNGIRRYKLVEICEQAEISDRTFHRYRRALEEIGFKIDCIDEGYIVNREESDFTIITNFSKISSKIKITGI